MTIKIIIFDLGNVVLTNDWHYECPEKFQEYTGYFGITYDDMEEGWKAYWPDFSRGKSSEDEFWKGFLGAAGAKKIDIEYAKKLYRKYQKPIENMLSLLERLKQNYRLAALTTISKEWLDFKRKGFALDNLFEAYVSSGYSGLKKSDPQIYDLILEKIGVKAEECIFIDDKKGNLAQAKKKGMELILFLNQKKLERRLHELNIEF